MKEKIFKKGLSKRLFSKVLCWAMVITLLPINSMITYADTPAHSLHESELTSTGGTLSDGNYYLNEDVTLTTNLTITGTVNLCLNGHVLKGTGSGSVITVNDGATLNLYDCGTTAHEGYVDANGLWHWDKDSSHELETGEAAETVTGGVITGGTGTSNNGGAVTVNGAFNMYGGTIAGCTATKGGGVFTWGNMTMNNNSSIVGCTATIDGGGVCACNCTVTMNNSSKVSDCTADNGAGGVYIWADSNHTASFTMEGNSTISGCIAKALNNSNRRSGGGVCVEGTNCIFTMNGGSICESKGTANVGSGCGGSVDVFSGTFNMKGGSIKNNTADTYCAGVFVNTDATFNMDGDSVISDNTGGQGAGVYTKGTFTMSGNSKVTNNTGTIGGGVGVQSGASFTMSESSKITNNTGTYGGGLCVNNGGLFQMFGSSTINNNIGSGYGGGVLANGSVTLGGEAKITGNTAGSGTKTANNLYLPSSKTVSLGTGDDAPKSGMSVGVTTQTVPTVDAPVDFANTADGSLIRYFFSDNDDYFVKAYVTGECLQLAATTGTGNVLNTTQGKRYNGFGESGATGTVLDEAANGDTLKLLDNVATNETIKIGKTLTLDLNGKVLKWTGDAYSNNNVIKVLVTGDLTLIDNNPTAAHYFKYSDSSAWTWDDTATTDAITLDAITGSTAENTPIIVTGGCITGGTEIAVKVCGDDAGEGVFTMTGGNIVGNTAANGAGVNLEATYGSNGEIYPCTFNMTGGRIIGNRAAGYEHLLVGHVSGMGGGMLMNGAGSRFNMTGGEICRNTTDGDGGGVEVSDGTITLGGTAKITGNLKGTAANNLYLGNYFGQKTVTLGTNGDAPATGFSVGVTMAGGTGVFSGANVADYSALFTPDAGSDYKVISRADDYKLKLVTKYAVTVDSSPQNGTVTTNAADDNAFEGDTVTITVTPDSGYQLKSLTVTDADSAPVVVTGNTFTMPAKAVTVTAEFEKIPTPSGGDYTPTVTVPVSGDKDSVKVTATVSGGNATVKNVTAEQLDKVGTGENVTIDLSGLNKSVSGVTIPKTTLENVASSEAAGLEVKLPNGTTAVFDKTTVAAIAEQAEGSNIQLVVDKDSNAEKSLTNAQKEAIKELYNPIVLDAYFVSNGKRISDFKGGKAELTAEYPTMKPIRVWYVADNGTKELVPSSFNGKTATFTVTHFSHYVIEQLDGSSYASCPQDAACPIAKFTDASTRGMVVTMLARLSGVDTTTNAVWFVPGTEWAVKSGISDGTNMTADITREQLATMLYRYAQLKNIDTNKFTENTSTLSCTDVFTISDWAGAGMHFCIAAGVVNGDNGMLYPTHTATRVEAAAMFQRFCEKVIAK